jgi:hypothetical protein
VGSDRATDATTIERRPSAQVAPLSRCTVDNDTARPSTSQGEIVFGQLKAEHAHPNVILGCPRLPTLPKPLAFFKLETTPSATDSLPRAGVCFRDWPNWAGMPLWAQYRRLRFALLRPERARRKNSMEPSLENQGTFLRGRRRGKRNTVKSHGIASQNSFSIPFSSKLRQHASFERRADHDFAWNLGAAISTDVPKRNLGTVESPTEACHPAATRPCGVYRRLRTSRLRPDRDRPCRRQSPPLTNGGSRP